LEETILDKIDLQIIRLLARDSRIPYRNLASIVGICANAVKERLNKMKTQQIIQNFVTRVNPAIFGYQKQCFLTVRYIGKTIKEEDILRQMNLLGDVMIYAKQLEGHTIFIIAVRDGAEDKIGILVDLLKPASVESMFTSYKPVSMKINISDLKIISCLLVNPKMEIADIAKEASISTKTVTRRLEKMKDEHVVEFSISRNISSMLLIGYIEFAVVILVERTLYQNILERIFQEMDENLLTSSTNEREVIFAVFFCKNIAAIEAILTRLDSFDGIRRIDASITTKVIRYQDWLIREINKMTANQK
jgi:DNA-binding Lrp family transcriptional regulator